ATHPTIGKVQAATALAAKKADEKMIDADFDGELQVDAALVPEIAARKIPESKVAGRATVLIFPDLNSGKMSTVARPATLLSGILRAAISGTSAASTCNSPSKSASIIFSSAFFAASAVAAWTLPMVGCVALPLVEYDSRATRGRVPSNCRASCAVDTAMSANCSTVGSGMTPQSARKSTPFSPKRGFSTSMIMQLEAVVVCGATLMIWNNGLSVLPVTSLAPETK